MVPDLVAVVILDCTSELVIVMNSLDGFIPSIVLLMVLTASKGSEWPFTMFMD